VRRRVAAAAERLAKLSAMRDELSESK